MSGFRCQVSHVRCNVSHVTCHMSRVMCYLSYKKKKLQSPRASWWRVCYQLRLQRLVFIIIIITSIAISRYFQIHPVVSSYFQLYSVVLAISSHFQPCSSSFAPSTYLQPITPIYSHVYLFPFMYRHSSHSQ